MIRASKRATKIHIRTMVRVLTGRHVICAVKHRFHGTHQRTPKHHTPATWDAGTQATPQEHVNPTRIQPTHFGSGGHISAAGRFRTDLHWFQQTKLGHRMVATDKAGTSGLR